jgi:hypothetical protein
MSAQPERSTEEVLAGLIERVTFHNAEKVFVCCAPEPVVIVML